MEENWLEKFNEETDQNKRVDILILKIIEYTDNKDISNAFKYASFAAVCTTSPRADICCLLGDLYVGIGNNKWAKIWYKNAISNATTYPINAAYYTWLPLVKLANISEDKKEAESYLSAAEILNPNYLKDIKDFI